MVNGQLIPCNNCADDLKEGPCGSTFVDALSCFIRSQEEGDNKGMDCLPAFKDFQLCLSKHNNAESLFTPSADNKLDTQPSLSK